MFTIKGMQVEKRLYEVENFFKFFLKDSYYKSFTSIWCYYFETFLVIEFMNNFLL